MFVIVTFVVAKRRFCQEKYYDSKSENGLLSTNEMNEILNYALADSCVIK